ncbi:GTA TIM-barrel-like domain protein [Ehrlichia chaffeensis str. Heartland]|uniref:baseplate megatron protein TIM-barrel domain-containing protein n=1 Tax=Ehrlichia chaffeensis TaxID=945 RepID=UPI000444D1BA|nr:glycoside hydrolase TIM-barrel-like domain-containing protein [Ehrlichia chaffeensis]AHX03887.1 GTA TIM-barrel-like domain protein [Ehrlichia chaffeensis str. Heartland]AHX10694.1 GTA TIM-barrel-like domain protein [Ehrlichia chaffeensis str. West Paces]
MSLIILSTIVNSVKESIEKFLLTEFSNIIHQDTQHNFSDSNIQTKHIPKINHLKIQTSSYGKMIPILYGSMRIAGNIIWMDKITINTNKDITVINNPNKKSTSHSSIQYTYHTSLAIAICTGHVKKISKIWVNSQPLDLDTITYRFYQGTEDQEPDPLILKLMGDAPAYRGLSYIVIEDFLLTDPKIPNFTFEVTAQSTNASYQEHITQKIKSIHIIPGSGEFAYDTKIQMKIFQQKIGKQYIPYGKAQQINNHSRHQKADALISLDQLQESLPNVQWISVIVNWYTDSLNIKDCHIYPAVEFKFDATTTPDNWHVAEINRETARHISQDNIIGGTINDKSLIRYIKELKTRGYKVLLYPTIIADIQEDSWIGNLTGDAEYISTFFNEQYNPFIKHYCNLTKDIIDAIVIGSSFIGLTRIKNHHNHYPAVDELIKLASYVKNQMGNNIIVTYAADWREYHSYNGYYNMDTLWSSKDIDVVGINAYFPLTDIPQPIDGFSEQDIINGWCSGEGYDYFYTNPETKQGKIPYTENNHQYSWKNIKKWWSQYHINPDNTITTWIPKLKKIWFTQYGFQSIDNCTSQPSVSIDYQYNKNPIFSKGHVNFHAQKVAINGTIKTWDNSDIVEQMFLWGWDIRPYPHFPELKNTWKDAKNWQTGYWIQEKLSLLEISHIIYDLLKSTGLQNNQIKIQNLHNEIDGYIITERQSTKSILNVLKDLYNFEIVEQDNTLAVIQENQLLLYNISSNDILSNDKNNSQKIIKTKASNLVHSINFMYINKNHEYNVSSQRVRIPNFENSTIQDIQVPIVLSDNQAKTIAENILNKKSNNKYNFYLTLPIKYVWLNTNDIIQVEYNHVLYKIKIINIYLENISISIEGVLYNSSLTTQHLIPDNDFNSYSDKYIIENPIHIFDFPCIHNIDNILYFAITRIKSVWEGSILYSYEDQDEHYKNVLSIDTEATTGITISNLGIGPIAIPDQTNKITIFLKTGQLHSIKSLFMDNSSNLALIGDEIIQFQNVKQIRENIYQLSYMLRGRFGTERHIDQHHKKELFTLLDNLPYLKINQSLINKSLIYKVVLKKSTSYAKQSTYTYYANNLKPLPVTHVKGNRDIYNNLTINWVRRARINGEWNDNTDTPIDEKFESYDIEISDNQNIVKRTITVKDSTTFVYSAQQQKIDFNSIQEKINVTIYQNSYIIGRGIAYKTTL